MTAPQEPLVKNLKRAGEQVLGAKPLTGNDHVRLSALLKVAALEIEALCAARDDAAELRAAVKAYFEAVHEYELFRVQEGDGPYPVSDEGDRFVELSHDLADAELRLKTLAATEGES